MAPKPSPGRSMARAQVSPRFFLPTPGPVDDDVQHPGRARWCLGERLPDQVEERGDLVGSERLQQPPEVVGRDRVAIEKGLGGPDPAATDQPGLGFPERPEPSADLVLLGVSRFGGGFGPLPERESGGGRLARVEGEHRAGLGRGPDDRMSSVVDDPTPDPGGRPEDQVGNDRLAGEDHEAGLRIPEVGGSRFRPIRLDGVPPEGQAGGRAGDLEAPLGGLRDRAGLGREDG